MKHLISRFLALTVLFTLILPTIGKSAMTRAPFRRAAKPARSVIGGFNSAPYPHVLQKSPYLVISDATAISAGMKHTCVLATGGRVRCWGSNDHGQLGDGRDPTTYNWIPQQVPGLGSGATAIAAGSFHTCAVATGGGVKCWGMNDDGQLGDGSNTTRQTPVEVSGLSSGVVSLAAGFWHTCALTTGGGVKCWGNNWYGQLGNSSNTTSRTPVDVSGLSSGVVAIEVGYRHTCALTNGGGVKCWGDNGSGQLGDGSGSNSSTPVDVQGLTSGVSAIAARGDTTCAVTTGGGAKCWGDNSYGKLGDGTNTDRWTPVDVSGLGSGVTAISAGMIHTCAVTTAGAVKCWGDNSYGQLGDGSDTPSLTPIDVSGVGNSAATIAAGLYHTCALMDGGGAKCWGDNRWGQLGIGSATYHWSPVDVSGLGDGVAAITAGGHHTCALLSSGGVKCWGHNDDGQLGDGSNIAFHLTPVDVYGLGSGVAAISAGWEYTCALTTGGGIKCWGDNSYGQLGDGSTTYSTTPVDVSGLSSGVVSISAGASHTCALTTGGGIKCWGLNEYGQLGDGSTTNSLTPVDVTGLSSGVKAITTVYHHTCALTTGGEVKCWGNNLDSQLGVSEYTIQYSPTPVDVSGLDIGVKAVAAGGYHTCALTAGGGVKCWGDNSSCQLGGALMCSVDSPDPVDVTGLSSGVAAIAAGDIHTCALTSGGGIECWGDNQFGQLGDGNTDSGFTPVDVSGLKSGVAVIAAGTAHTCALTTGGGAKCWGYKGYGQLGDGSAFFGPSAQNVAGFDEFISFLPITRK